MHDREKLEAIIKAAKEHGWELKHRDTAIWTVEELAEYVDYRGEKLMLMFNQEFMRYLWGDFITEEEITDEFEYEYRDKHGRWYDEYGDLNVDTFKLSEFKQYTQGFTDQERKDLLEGELVSPDGMGARQFVRLKNGKVIRWGWNYHSSNAVVAEDQLDYFYQNMDK